ncbi:hypothetical protein DPEC_G00162860 [Dallia pectoralis]|uniref:Uncharacterized protein n=1 Tax=Dallia pectoralis TaxID=75939 RepID=A0ACC2GH05_DALPE|nr:hypothetical protein DPEC_G00162860 [Dallia pectoralis]
MDKNESNWNNHRHQRSIEFPLKTWSLLFVQLPSASSRVLHRRAASAGVSKQTFDAGILAGTQHLPELGSGSFFPPLFLCETWLLLRPRPRPSSPALQKVPARDAAAGLPFGWLFPFALLLSQGLAVWRSLWLDHHTTVASRY